MRGAFFCVRLSFTDDDAPKLLHGFANVGMMETIFDFADRFEKITKREKWLKMDFFLRYVDMVEGNRPFQTTWYADRDE